MKRRGLLAMLVLAGAAPLTARAAEEKKKTGGADYIPISTLTGTTNKPGGRRGVLTVDGVDHPFSVSGLSVVDLGSSRVTASGEVFGLRKLEDFDGTYQGVSLGVAVGGGSEVVAMRNEKGVFIRMRAGQQGVRLSLATKGTTLRLE